MAHHLLLAAATAAPHRDGPCLCIFDIDRTLTASQAAARKGSHNQCPAAHSFDHPYIKDTAYGGGGPLAFSEVGQHIENSFCKCWLGIISTGDAAGEGSSMRRELYGADPRGSSRGGRSARSASAATPAGATPRSARCSRRRPSKERSGKKKRERRRDPTGYGI